MKAPLVNMIEIGNTLVSLDVIEEQFVCDLHACHGSCCVGGDSGAPLEQDEMDYLESNYPLIEPFLTDQGRDTINSLGKWVLDVEHEHVTPLINGKECAYMLTINGIAACGIEKAYEAGAITFQKPLSCHLYPIRIKKFKRFEAVNYDRWDICKAALVFGRATHTPVYVFLKEPLIRKYGKDWYEELSLVAGEYLKQHPTK